MRKIYKYLFMTALIAAIDVFLIEPYNITVKKIILKSKKIPLSFSNFKIVQISDLHLNRYGAKEEKVVSILKNIKPDLLIISGDFYGREYNLTGIEDFIDRIKDTITADILATYGNWDHMGGIIKLESLLESKNLTLLNNNNTRIMKGNDFINIAGVDDPYTGYDKIKSALSGIDFDHFTILVAHAPDITKNLNSEKFDLIISGHTHGGQVSFPLLQKIWVPTDTDYVRGMYDTQWGKLYINRGIGTSLLPVRFFCSPEITVFRLVISP